MPLAFVRKPLTGLLLLAGAAGGPYMLFETDAGRQVRQGTGSWMGGSTASATAPTAGTLPTGEDWFGSVDHLGDPLNPDIEPDSHAQPPITSVAEVLRFDITPQWVMQRFPRVSTRLADTQLDGLRVPIVTGTTPSDLAGTLTYYFDRYQRLQRISLYCVTGDPARFVSELQQVYRLEQQPSLGGTLYLLKWNRQPSSILHVAPAPVIYAQSPYARYNLFIELNQPGLEYGLSQEARQLFESGKQVKTW